MKSEVLFMAIVISRCFQFIHPTKDSWISGNRIWYDQSLHNGSQTCILASPTESCTYAAWMFDNSGLLDEMRELSKSTVHHENFLSYYGWNLHAHLSEYKRIFKYYFLFTRNISWYGDVCEWRYHYPSIQVEFSCSAIVDVGMRANVSRYWRYL